MRRFFKSAAFPILIVIVLAFFLRELATAKKSTEPVTYGAFIQQLEAGQIKSVELKTKDNTATVTPNKGDKYDTGYTDDSANELENRMQALLKAHKLQKYDIQPSKTNTWVSLLTYLLPVILLIGFWLFLMNQVQG